MEQAEALKKFLGKEVKQASDRFVLANFNHMKKEEAPEHVKEFADAFRELFKLCKKENRDVRFVQIVLRRSKALLREPFYRLEAFGQGIDDSSLIAVVEPNLEWLYREYDKFCEEVDRQSKKYVMCFTDHELNRIKQIELINCRRMVRHLFERAVVYIINSEEYRELQIQEGFQVHMAEYRGPYKIIFETDEYTAALGKVWYGLL